MAVAGGFEDKSAGDLRDALTSWIQEPVKTGAFGTREVSTGAFKKDQDIFILFQKQTAGSGKADINTFIKGCLKKKIAVVGFTEKLQKLKVDPKTIQKVWNLEKEQILQAARSGDVTTLKGSALSQDFLSKHAVVDDEGNTALQIALSAGHTEAAVGLIKKLNITKISKEDIEALFQSPLTSREELIAAVRTIPALSQSISQIIDTALEDNDLSLLFDLQKYNLVDKKGSSPLDCALEYHKSSDIGFTYDDVIPQPYRKPISQETIDLLWGTERSQIAQGITEGKLDRLYNLTEPLIKRFKSEEKKPLEHSILSGNPVAVSGVISKLGIKTLSLSDVAAILKLPSEKQGVMLNALKAIPNFSTAIGVVIDEAIRKRSEEVLFFLQKEDIKTAEGLSPADKAGFSLPTRLSEQLKLFEVLSNKSRTYRDEAFLSKASTQLLLFLFRTQTKDSSGLLLDELGPVEKTKLIQRAIKTNDPELFIALQNQGFNDTASMSPLHVLMDSPDPLTPELLTAAKKIIQEGLPASLNKKGGKRGTTPPRATPFELACSTGKTEIVKEFVKSGKVSLTAKNSEDGNTILSRLCTLDPLSMTANHFQVIDLLIKGQTQDDFFIKNGDELNPAQATISKIKQLKEDIEELTLGEKEIQIKIKETSKKLVALKPSGLTAELENLEAKLVKYATDIQKISDQKQKLTEHIGNLEVVINQMCLPHIQVGKDINLSSRFFIEFLNSTKLPTATAQFLVTVLKDGLKVADPEVPKETLAIIQSICTKYDTLLATGSGTLDALRTAFLEEEVLRDPIDIIKVKSALQHYQMPDPAIALIINKFTTVAETAAEPLKFSLEGILGEYRNLRKEKIPPLDALRLSFLIGYEIPKVDKLKAFVLGENPEMQFYKGEKPLGLELFREQHKVYVVTKKLGEGSFKIAERIVEITTKPKALVRLTLKPDFEPQEIGDMLKEISILREIQGEGVVAIHEVVSLPRDRKELTKVLSTKGILVEECQDLEKTLKTLPKEDVVQDIGALQERMGIFVDILKGVKRLHDKGYVWSDAKGENCFIARDEEGRLRGKISDMGTATKKGEAPWSTITEYHAYGSPANTAPELYAIPQGTPLPPSMDFQKTDMWALGNVGRQLYNGQEYEFPSVLGSAFRGDVGKYKIQVHKEVMDPLKALKAIREPTPAEKAKIEFYQVLQGLNNPNPSERWNINEALAHAEAAYDALEKLAATPSLPSLP